MIQNYKPIKINNRVNNHQIKFKKLNWKAKNKLFHNKANNNLLHLYYKKLRN